MSAERRRVVVTGMGLVTSLGNDVATSWAGLMAGRSGVRTIEAFDPSRLASRIAGEVHDLDASGILDRKELRRTDRYIQFGLVAAREALDQAGLPERFEGELAERTGVILGTGLGGVGTLIDGFSINVTRGPDRISPFLIPMGIPNIGAGQIAIQFGMTGPELHDRVGLRDGRPRPGRGERDHPARRRRRHGRRRCGGRHLRGDGRRLRGDAGAVDPQRRSGGGLAAVRHGARRVRHGRGRGRRRPRGAWTTPRRAAPRSWASWSATARRPTPPTSRCPRRAGSAPSGRPAARSTRRA